jgi:hypothetical protein
METQKMTEAPFILNEAVRPKKALLDHYPGWAPEHDRMCTIARIEPSFNNKREFQGWEILIMFPGESTKWVVSQHDLMKEELK